MKKLICLLLPLLALCSCSSTTTANVEPKSQETRATTTQYYAIYCNHPSPCQHCRDFDNMEEELKTRSVVSINGFNVDDYHSNIHSHYCVVYVGEKLGEN